MPEGASGGSTSIASGGGGGGGALPLVGGAVSFDGPSRGSASAGGAWSDGTASVSTAADAMRRSERDRVVAESIALSSSVAGRPTPVPGGGRSVPVPGSGAGLVGHSPGGALAPFSGGLPLGGGGGGGAAGGASLFGNPHTAPRSVVATDDRPLPVIAFGAPALPPAPVNAPPPAPQGGTAAPLAPTQTSTESVRWFYRDNAGNVQGPFATSKMKHWLAGGHFPPTLEIRADGGPFAPLAVAFPDAATAFSELPRGGGGSAPPVISAAPLQGVLSLQSIAAALPSAPPAVPVVVSHAPTTPLSTLGGGGGAVQRLKIGAAASPRPSSPHARPQLNSWQLKQPCLRSSRVSRACKRS